MESVPQNLGYLLRNTQKKFPAKKAFFYKENNKYQSITWTEFLQKVNAIATSFAKLGLKKGDRLVIFSENRPQWAMVDMAAQTLGAISVPIYTSLTPHEIEYLLNDSGACFLAVSNKNLIEKILPIQKSIPSLRHILAFDSTLALLQKDFSIPIHTLHDLEKEKPDLLLIDEKLAAVGSDDLASIIYTSGTTGNPKGVMLSHNNFIQNVLYSRNALKMGESDFHLSFLPLSHVFERTAGYYLMVFIGASIAYAENIDAVPQNLLEIKPTFILGVPRFFEKIQARVLDAVEKAGPFRKALFSWAQALGQAKREAYFNKKSIGLGLKAKLAIAHVLVYKKFSKRLGGRIRFCVSGGAPLNKEIATFFYDLGVMIYEGYGLSETSPVISANRENRFKFGTVGIPLEEVQVKIASDGEIITKSPCVMKGYYQKPEETSLVIDAQGWFHTGDLGNIDKDGFLSITGRKKEIIVTSGGKKISPRPIEEALEKDPYILRAVLFGDGQKFITALIVPQKEKLLEYALFNKISYQSYDDLLENPKIYEFYESNISALTESLASFEKIKYFVLLPNDFSQSSGELTPTLKVKREVVFSRYKARLLPLYEREKTV